MAVKTERDRQTERLLVKQKLKIVCVRVYYIYATLLVMGKQ